MWRNDSVIRENSHPTLFGADIILLNIRRHPKICHLTFLSFTDKDISGRQVAMDYLKESYAYRCPTSLLLPAITGKTDHTIPFSE